MSSVSSTTESSLLAEARAAWLQQAQTKAAMTGSKVPQTPSDSELKAEDAELAAEIKAAEKAAESLNSLSILA